MVDVAIMNKNEFNEYAELSEQKTEKRRITLAEVEEILLGLNEQKNYWENIKDKIKEEKLKV